MRKKEIHAVSIIHRVHEHRVHNHPSRLNFDSFIHSHAQSRGSPLDRRSRVRIRPERATTPSFILSFIRRRSPPRRRPPSHRVFIEYVRSSYTHISSTAPHTCKSPLSSRRSSRVSLLTRVVVDPTKNPIQSNPLVVERRGGFSEYRSRSSRKRNENETKRTNSRVILLARCPGPLRSRAAPSSVVCRRASRRLSPRRPRSRVVRQRTLTCAIQSSPSGFDGS